MFERLKAILKREKEEYCFERFTTIIYGAVWIILMVSVILLLVSRNLIYLWLIVGSIVVISCMWLKDKFADTKQVVGSINS